MDNKPSQVDNPAQLLTKLNFFEELTATPSAAAAGHLQTVAAAGPAVALIKTAPAGPAAPLARTAAAGYYTHIIIALLHTCYI